VLDACLGLRADADLESCGRAHVTLLRTDNRTDGTVVGSIRPGGSWCGLLRVAAVFVVAGVRGKGGPEGHPGGTRRALPAGSRDRHPLRRRSRPLVGRCNGSSPQGSTVVTAADPAAPDSRIRVVDGPLTCAVPAG